VHIDTLRELLALHLQPRRARGVERELSLLNHAQIDLADLVLNLREVQRALIVVDVLDKNGIAIT
jgi:hypothetical protein